MAPEHCQTLARIEAAVRAGMPLGDPAHDISHLERVVSTARFLLREEGLSDGADLEFQTLAACWLHDWVQTPKGSSPAGEDAFNSAERAAELLAMAEAPPGSSEVILSAIREHSFSAGASPTTLPSAILQDADRIDALGNMGIARLWAVASAGGSALYDPDDPAAQNRPIDDRRFALDHIQAKLLGLPATMSTASGRNLASRRAAIVRDFFQDFLGELGVVPPPPTPLMSMLMDGQARARLVFPGEPTPRLLDAARALNAKPEQILKSLLFVAPDGEAVMAIASGPARVSDEALCRRAGLQSLRLAKPDAVRQHTGYEVGAVPPIGLPANLPVIVDTGVTRLEVAYGGGGRVDALLQISPGEIVRANGAQVAGIVE